MKLIIFIVSLLISQYLISQNIEVEEGYMIYQVISKEGLNIRSIPNKEGKIIATGLRGNSLKVKLEEIFGE